MNAAGRIRLSSTCTARGGPAVDVLAIEGSSSSMLSSTAFSSSSSAAVNATAARLAAGEAYFDDASAARFRDGVAVRGEAAARPGVRLGVTEELADAFGGGVLCLGAWSAIVDVC